MRQEWEQQAGVLNPEKAEVEKLLALFFPETWAAAAELMDLLAWLEFLNRPGERPNLFAEAEAVIREALARQPQVRQLWRARVLSPQM